MDPAILILALAVVFHAFYTGRPLDIKVDRRHTEFPAAIKQANALAKIADLIDRELPSGYKHLDKMREREREHRE